MCHIHSCFIIQKTTNKNFNSHLNHIHSIYFTFKQAKSSSKPTDMGCSNSKKLELGNLEQPTISTSQQNTKDSSTSNINKEEIISSNKETNQKNMSTSAVSTKNYTIDEAFAILSSAPNCTSLVHKYLTPEIYEQLKSTESKLGTTLLDMIRSGVDNLDSGTGVYAADNESYTLFAPLMNPIINAYHLGYNPATDIHPKQNFDPQVFSTVDKHKQRFIISTRIRVARNVSGYNLGATITNEKRLKLEKLISETLLNISDPSLKGKYYPLANMDPEVQQQLIDDHFLFKKGDRFLESAGLNRDWPHGRGIFFNDEKTFLVWINEEDQLRIISMEMGGDVFSVFSRLGKVVEILSACMKFSYDEHLGYISSCPTNLGTGMRASVHMPLDWIAAKFNYDHKAVKKYCREKYSVQLRGVHGEHSNSVGNIFDISNSVRLGQDEVACAKQMYDGVIALVDEETEIKRELVKSVVCTVLVKDLQLLRTDAECQKIVDICFEFFNE